MSEKPIWPRDTRVKKKEKWPKAKKKKRKRRKENNKAEGLKEKKNESTKCLSMPKA